MGIYYMVIYARLERTERGVKKQLLEDHIQGTVGKVEKLLQAALIKHILQPLVNLTDTNYIELIQAARLAALFHDIGKILQYYQKQAVDVEKQEKEALAFPMHEVVSVNIYVQACNMYIDAEQRYPFTSTWLVSLATQAILLHHQGLRTITIEKLHQSSIKQMIYEDYNRNVENLRTVISSLIDVMENSMLNRILKILKNNVGKALEYNPREIQSFYHLQDSIQVELGRIVTACLMIADSWDAYEAVKGRASRYIRDVILKYTEILT
jgi:CRISPR-associated endonuclease Cas3-HD